MTATLPSLVRLSTEQLRRNVLGVAPRTAVFDFDGTLWPGDAGSGFLRWSIDTALLSQEAVDHIQHRHACYHRGEVDEISICGEMTQIYRGLTEAAVRESAARYFAAQVQSSFFEQMTALVHDLQRAGTEVWAVSSTNNWVIEEGVRELGIPANRVLAAEVAIHDGVVSDLLVDVPSDEGKAAALRRAGLHRPSAVFGNSIHDLAMLEMAAFPFPINPTPALAEESAQRGWAVYYPDTDEGSL